MSLGRSDPIGFTGLHCTAYIRIVEIADGLLELKKWDLGATDVEGNTAILWAARKGHEAIMKIFLEQEDATPITTDKDSRTLSRGPSKRSWGHCGDAFKTKKI